MVLVLLLVLSVGTAATAAEPWYQHYERGLERVEAGDGAAAHAAFAAALEALPEPGLGLHTAGVRYIDYLPHLYLAVSAQMSGDVEEARRELRASEEAGVAARSEVGSKLLAAYKVLLAEPAETPPEAEATPVASEQHGGYREYPRKAEVLPAEEVERLREATAVRCGLPADTRDSGAPWYFHYEMGLALADKGDPQRALDALVAAADKRPQPGHSARMYGMWFTDYMPYLQIARAHVALGNWSCAFDALEMSRSTGEVTEADARFPEFVELLDEVEAHRDE